MDFHLNRYFRRYCCSLYCLVGSHLEAADHDQTISIVADLTILIWISREMGTNMLFHKSLFQLRNWGGSVAFDIKESRHSSDFI